MRKKTLPLTTVAEKAQRRGYPDPRDMMGELLEEIDGVQVWRRSLHGDTDHGYVVDYHEETITICTSSLLLHDEAERRRKKAAGQVETGLEAWGLNPDEVERMKERHERLAELLDEAVSSGMVTYPEQWEGFERGQGLPPREELLDTIAEDVRRFKENPVEEPVYHWLGDMYSYWTIIEGEGYHIKRGRMTKERASSEAVHGPFRSYKEAKQRGERETTTPAPEGLFAE